LWEWTNRSEYKDLVIELLHEEGCERRVGQSHPVVGVRFSGDSSTCALDPC